MAATGRRGGPADGTAEPLTVDRLLRECGLPRIEAEILLAAASGRSRTWLYAHGGDAMPAPVVARFQELANRRTAGEPIAYITGRRAFWTLDLEVGPGVLIPRPDTELLVEAALARCPAANDLLDLGTGSGALALALASERPDSRVVATDLSMAALRQASGNARRLGIDNVTFLQSRWLSALQDCRFDLIVSNPPYLAASDPHLAQGDLRFEPASALVAGADGLDDLRVIIAQSAARLRPEGWLLVEHGHEQQPAVMALLEADGWREITGLRDLEDRPRVVAARRP